MDSYSTTTTDPTQNLDLNSLLGGTSGEPLISEGMVTFFIVCFVLINLLTLVFLILWIMGMVRRWKVQSAVLHMQKDIAEIKELLVKPVKPVSVQPVAKEPEVTITATDQVASSNQ